MNKKMYHKKREEKIEPALTHHVLHALRGKNNLIKSNTHA